MVRYIGIFGVVNCKLAATFRRAGDCKADVCRAEDLLAMSY